MHIVSFPSHGEKSGEIIGTMLNTVASDVGKIEKKDLCDFKFSAQLRINPKKGSSNTGIKCFIFFKKFLVSQLKIRSYSFLLLLYRIWLAYISPSVL